MPRLVPPFHDELRCIGMRKAECHLQLFSQRATNKWTD
jgi:hypothetical protein